jgi:hypothetical protein
MVVYPSLCFHEQSLVICYDGAACLNYWRAGVALSHRPDAAPITPLGTLLVAYITQGGGSYRPGGWPMRIFYLSCLGVIVRRLESSVGIGSGPLGRC